MNSLRDWFHWFPDFWYLQIIVIDGQPITPGKIIIGLALFVAGWIFSRSVAKQVVHRLISRLEIEPALKFALEKAVFYVLIAIVALFVLRLISVPITIFAFLGGALAIGIGFGSQNIINNFISGLILMIERPIRVGDLIEVEGLTGTVETIGARSTLVRVGDNTQVIIPNSKLLENNLRNWTLDDDIVRARVRLGVAYGSPVETVIALLRQSVQNVRGLVRGREPIVQFVDFGDNALIFELLFWIHLREGGGAGTAESAARFEIDRLFREHNVNMPFPQRELHLNPAKPLQVEILRQ